jgi:hypothetical protein
MMLMRSRRKRILQRTWVGWVRLEGGSRCIENKW